MKPVTKQEVEKIKKKYPNMVLVVLKKHSQLTPDLDKCKYIVPWDLTMQQFSVIVRSRLHLKRSEALFLFSGNVLVHMQSTMASLQRGYPSDHGALELTYSLENTFGN